jgi:putative membrane protein
MDTYLLLKALHIIVVVTWFAGLFYMPRLFIYHTEAGDKPDSEKKVLQDQFKIMQKRLWYGITWPSAIMVLIFGTSLIQFFLPFKENPWLHIKLLFVAGLYGYQYYLHTIFLNQQKNLCKLSSTKLRVINEISTVFLVAIVFLVVLKDTLNFIYAVLGLFVFIGILLLGIKTYKKLRTARNKN